jgi:hypothetical protein
MAGIRDPRGEEPGPETIETGLKSIVRDAGPSVRELSRCTKPGFKALMAAARVPADWPDDAKASAVLTVIQELVEAIRNSRWRTAAMAAFRIPPGEYVGPDYDSRNARWRALAEREGAEDIRARVENYRDYWQSAVRQLAAGLEDRLQEMNRTPESWQRFEDDSQLAPRSPQWQPPAISFDRTDVLYQFHGYIGTQVTSQRWLHALEPVDHYEAVGWYYSQPDAPVQIVPLANCTIEGPVHELPMGGVLCRLQFSHLLAPGEEYYFSYVTRYNSDRPCRPTILYEVRAREMRDLTVRAQFDITALPASIWYFDVGTQSDGWEVPEAEAPARLPIASNGYVEHRFDVCERGRYYGLKWTWPDIA